MSEGWEAPEIAKYRRHHRGWAIYLGCALFGMGALGGFNGIVGVCLAIICGAGFALWLLVGEVDDAITHGAWEQHEHEWNQQQERWEA